MTRLAFAMGLCMLLAAGRNAAAQGIRIGASGHAGLGSNRNGAPSFTLNAQLQPLLYVLATGRRGTGVSAGVGLADYRYRSYSYLGRVFGTQRLRYLEVPLALHFPVGRRKSRLAVPYGQVGLSLGWLLDAQYEASAAVRGNPVTKSAANKDDFHGLAVRALLGGGAIWWPERRLNLLTGLQSNIGLYNQNRNNEVQGQSQEVGLSGLALRIGLQARLF